MVCISIGLVFEFSSIVFIRVFDGLRYLGYVSFEISFEVNVMDYVSLMFEIFHIHEAPSIIHISTYTHLGLMVIQ